MPLIALCVGDRSSCTSSFSPSRDGAGVIGLGEPGGPGDTDGIDDRVVSETRV